jgi:hypothetical protein
MIWEKHECSLSLVSSDGSSILPASTNLFIFSYIRFSFPFLHLTDIPELSFIPVLWP